MIVVFVGIIVIISFIIACISFTRKDKFTDCTTLDNWSSVCSTQSNPCCGTACENICYNASTQTACTQCIEGQEYLKKVYPGPNPLNLPIPHSIDKLTLLYPFAPQFMKNRFLQFKPFFIVGDKAFTFNKNNPTHSVKKNQFIPISAWQNPIPDGLLINTLDPSSDTFWTQTPVVPKYLEITSRLPQGGPGNWVNHVVGSGIFYKCGKTLVARNKIQALHLLGMSFKEMALLFPDFTWAWDAHQTSKSQGAPSWKTEKDYIAKKLLIYSLPELFQNIAYNTNRIMPLEWMSNSAELDGITYYIALHKGYQTVWYYCTGYAGFWSSEAMSIKVEEPLQYQTLPYGGPLPLVPKSIPFSQLVKQYMFTTEGPCVFDTAKTHNKYLACK